MKGPWAVRMKIVGMKGACPSGHEIGEEHVVRDKSPGGLCMGSLNAVLPYVTALRYGGSFPWTDREGEITIGCPDHENCVVWKLERLPEEV